LKKNIENELIAGKELWSLVEAHNFTAIIAWLSAKGVHEDKMGEVLFSFSQQALSKKKPAIAKIILFFLTEALEDPSEAPPIFKLIGDIYFMESDYEKARNFYGKLPMTPKNICLCFNTFIPRLEIDELFSFRDTVLLRIMKESHDQIHSMINKLMMQVIAVPEIFKAHKDLFKHNFDCLKTIPPFNNSDNLLDQNCIPITLQSWQPDIIKINDRIYIKRDDIWQKMISNKGPDIKAKKGFGENIMVYCNSPESLFDFIEKIQTDYPEFIKAECRVIINFNLFHSVLGVFNLFHLKDCDYFIRFIDSNHIKSQLTHILLERKLPFTNRVLYLSKDDSIFFSKQIIPILKECEKIMHQDVERYEQKLLGLFPDDYYNKVVKKINTGKKLRIIFFTSRFTSYMQHSTRDIAEGFNQLGHTTYIEIEDKDSGVSIRKDVCLKNLIDFKPDIIFSINHFRYSYPWIPRNIPFVTWVQDLLPGIRNVNDPGLVSDRDHIFSFSKLLFPEFFENHPVFKKKRITFLPIPINNKIYHPLNNVKKKYDVIYITHISDNLDDVTLAGFRQGNPPAGNYSSREIQFLTQLSQKIGHMSLRELCYTHSGNEEIYKDLAIKVCRDISMDYSDDLLVHLQPVNQNGETLFFRDIRIMIKTRPVQFLINNGINIKVFGNNWNKLKGFENAAMGPIENGLPLNQVLNQSKIVLNISPVASWHMRAADAIGSGSFTLTFLDKTDDVPMSDLLEEKKEMVGFKDEKDLLGKINYYLNNETERSTIAQNAYNKACAKYSSQSHAGTILNTIVTAGFI
jgi:spore maturation protein CgeB